MWVHLTTDGLEGILNQLPELWHHLLDEVTFYALTIKVLLEFLVR